MAMLGLGDYLCEACGHFDTDGEDGNHPWCFKQIGTRGAHRAIRVGESCPFGYEFGVPSSYPVNHERNKERAYEIKAMLDKEETEYVNGIEVLAGLCDEYGLQHWDSEAMACETHIFVDKAGNPHECWESPSGMVNVVIAMTPEQAVMLGTETCHDVGDPSDFCCSECGVRMFTESNDTYTMIDSLGNIIEQPNFCPNCGKKVVDE